jgi:16S rRNA (guanine527-N7)-methyltransferase
VEHRRTRCAAEPQALARRVCALVQRELAKLRFSSAARDFIHKIEMFAAALALWGSRMNLTARPADPQEVAFHIIDSLMPAIIAGGGEQQLLAGAFDANQRVLDLGSGAGFPGLVLAAATPADFTLVESRRKRASFLKVAIAEMGIENATVEAVRMHALDFTPGFDLAVARAFGAPGAFYAIAEQALKPGGVAILYASPSQRLGLDAAHSHHLGAYTRIAYEVSRGNKSVKRVLALWRKC